MKKISLILVYMLMIMSVSVNAQSSKIQKKTFDDGVYEGMLVNGLREGHGIMRYDNEQVYDGEWKNDKRNGQGTLTWPDVYIYKGEWKDGKKDGHGILTIPTDSMVFDAEWKDDKLNGYGVQSSKDGIYTGEFKNGKCHGQGQFKFSNGDEYVGEFVNGAYGVVGTYIYADGSKFEGGWKNNKKNGDGTFIFPDGSKINGEWKDDNFTGRGRFIGFDVKNKSYSAFDESGYFDYSKVSNIPFLSTNRYSLDNDDEDMFSFNNKVRKKYNEYMKAVIFAKNVEEQKTANQKMLKFLLGVVKSKDTNTRYCAEYELGHYYAYGIFDPYYRLNEPSNIDRTGNYAVDKLQAEQYLKDHIDVCYLKMIPFTSMSELSEGLKEALIDHASIEDTKCAFYYLTLNFKISLNIYELGKSLFEECSYCDETIDYKLDHLLYIIDYVKGLPKSHDMRKWLLDEELSDSELIKQAKESEKTSLYNAYYYYALSTLRGIIGNYNSYTDLYKLYSSSIMSHFEKEHPSLVNRGELHSTLLYQIYDMQYFCEDAKLNPFCNAFNSAVEKYYKETSNELSEAYEDQKKEEKRERNRRRWADFGKFALQVAEQGLATISQMNAASHSSSSSVNNAPLLSMSNSQFAAKNQQELNALMLKSRNDVNAQYWNEYQQFATYNKKPDGSNYSFDEWMALQGQAIQNLKNEGYDILAENQKRIDQQKADFEAERKADKEALFEKMGYGKPSSTASTNSTSNTTSSTISAKDDKVKTSQTVENSTNENLDSKQQYHTDAVSSDDYKYEKKVSLYIRDGNTNREMFSNKDLCKKDATYYVKLDNKYYRVESGSNWGFNSYIMYSSKRLMFNK